MPIYGIPEHMGRFATEKREMYPIWDLRAEGTTTTTHNNNNNNFYSSENHIESRHPSVVGDSERRRITYQQR